MKTIEYFYSSHSAFAYLGSARLNAIAAAANARIIHRPVDLRVLLDAIGPGAIGNLTPARHEYYFGIEIERWSAWRQAPIARRRPTHHDNSLALSSGVLIAATDRQLDIDRLAHEMLTAHWRDDADLANQEDLIRIIEKADMTAEPLLADAMTPRIQAIYQQNTAEAIERNVFGSPTYFTNGEMFYGQDRLDFLERALAA